MLYLKDGQKAVTSINEEETLLAIRRFMALRGNCINFYSDNGSSFCAVKEDLRGKVKWYTIPEGSPW